MGHVWVGLLMICTGFSLLLGGFFVLLGAGESRPDPEVTSTFPPIVPPPLVVEPTPGLSLEPDKIAAPVTPQPSELTAEQKGRKFEDWVVKRFRRDLFAIKEWRGDKFVDGVFAESSKYPDLEVEFHLRETRQLFAIECKWRGRWESGGKPGRLRP